MTHYALENHTVSKSDPELSWRLVHDDGEILGFFESTGYTETIHTLFTGTESECRAEIARLGLTEPALEIMPEEPIT